MRYGWGIVAYIDHGPAVKCRLPFSVSPMKEDVVHKQNKKFIADSNIQILMTCDQPYRRAYCTLYLRPAMADFWRR